jgi:hypothetical protein
MFFFCDCLRPQQKAKRKEGAVSPVPKYKVVDRSKCELLRLCWERNWDAVLARCKTHPEEAFCRSRNTDRTALHLATMPGAKCPAPVLLTLLETNPHAVVVRDDHRYRGGTPLHFLCGSAHRNNHDLVNRFVQSALNFDEKWNTNTNTNNTVSIGSSSSEHAYYSPLLLAAKMAARVQTLKILVQTRRQTLWIAPWTGGEAAYPAQNVNNPLLSEEEEKEEYSPLCCLWKVVVEPHLTDISLEASQRMRQIAETMLSDENASLQGISRHTDEEESWTKLLVLLREHVQHGTLLHTVTTLYIPMPGLVKLTATIFPEQAQEMDQTGCLPLHSFFQCPLDPWSKEHKEIVQILIESQPDTLAVPDGPTGLQPIFLAASRNAPLDTIVSMLIACPVALELQRVAEREKSNF